MKTLLQFSTLGILSLLLVLIFIPFIKKIAVKVNLVDKPNYRKIHTNAVPLIGGISIALSVLIVLIISGNQLTFLKEYLPILSSGYVLLIIGIIDDKTDLSAKYKLIIQLLLAFIIALSGTRITTFYGFLGVYEIEILAQYLLTIIVITGVVNAFNLMDGVDGLVGGLSLLGFTMFLVSSVFYNDYFLAKVCVIFIGAIFGFLKFNLSKNKIFMGDAGSLFLGFILVTLGIHFMEKQHSTNNYGYAYIFLILVAFFSIPVLDSIRVYLGRIKQGKSPFKADKSHLHHLLLTAGLTHKKISLFVVIFCMILFFIGFGLISYFSTTVIILAIMTLFWTIVKLLLMISSLHQWRAAIKKLEQQ
ncbi:glycosyltransferase family 4 protein [Flavobacterium sp.]|uniref:glycosyltransferase family 4 protein n=1 Tax=Flavobacterium sp. TaxID=239 RepID=UPI0026244F6D|nr:MraY family glycosyltransferase [Flavobacterium sp.]